VLLLAGGLLALPMRSTGKPTSATAPAGEKAKEGEKGKSPKAPPQPNRVERVRRIRQQFAKARKIATLNRKLIRLFQAGKFKECEPVLREILEIDPRNNVAWYNLACYHSRVGQKDKAIESLNKAVEYGYSAFGHLQRDPDLEPIRKTSGFKKLLARKDQIHREQAAKVRDRPRKPFGDGYLYEIDHDRKLVFATNVDRRTLDDMKRRLTAYASAQWKGLFTHPFERYLTIVIPKSSDWARPEMGGFYSRAAHMLHARTVGLTLVHEFTHALHAADQDGLGQMHPIWLTEALATLFESSKVVNGSAEPQPNRRLYVLQMFVRRKRTLPFKDLMEFDHPTFMTHAAIAYAQGRYMMVYLYQKGVLKKWYDAYTAGYEDDRTGAKAMEKVLGKKLAEIEKDWGKWVLQQEPPVLRLPPKHAYIGIQLRPGVDGVHVVRVVPGSGAHKAGLKADDVIVKIDGERTIDPGHLMNIVYQHEVGDKLKLQYRRDGKYRTVTVTLGAMPEPPRRGPRRPRRGRRPAPKPATRPATGPAPKKTP
jgi:tetratricopeptide (TPR) repeat protein